MMRKESKIASAQTREREKIEQGADEHNDGMQREREI
jgi:hypothetical protein